MQSKSRICMSIDGCWRKKAMGNSWHLDSWQRSVETIFVPRVISCLVGVSSRGPSRLFLQFPFSPFFTSSLSPAGRGRWVRGFSTERNRPCVWPRRPHLPTPQHTCSQWGLCNTGPKPTPAFPQKTGNRDWLSSCFSTNFLLCCPFPRLFSLFFFWFLSGWMYLINFLSSKNKLLWCSQ